MANFPQQKDNIPDVLAALREEFATSVNNVYINSLNKTYSFRDLTVLEQKTFSKLTIDHENEPDFIYDAQCALIKKLCTDPEFDVYSITEFDRLKIFFLIYQANFFNNSYTITCPQCDTKFEYTLDFDSLIKTIDTFDISDAVLEHTVKNRKYEFVINFPSVKRMADYKKYQAFQNRKNKVKSQDSSTTLIDMMDLLIKKLTITNLTTNNVIEIVPENLKYSDYVLYLETIPQSIIYSESSPIITAAKEKFAMIKKALPKVLCPNCNESIEIIGDIDGFFI